MKKSKLFLILVFVSYFVLFSSFGFSLTAQENVIFKTNMGDVVFGHYKHMSQINNCITCHHKGWQEGKCSNCHTPETISQKTVFHKLCKNCHKENKGPTNCNECHKK